MRRKFFIVFILSVLVSCSQQKIIPENTLAEIIYRMYIADVVLSTREPSMMYKDSLRIYEPVIEKFGYSFDDLRRTFLKYTAEDGKLQSVLKKVAKRIEDEKSIYQDSARIEKLSENMNVGADSISIVSRTANKQQIEVTLSEQGVYDISASYFFYKNDSTKNPKMTAWLESRMHKDSIMEKQEISLVKDTVFADYQMRVKFSDPAFNILRVYWLDFEQEPAGVSKPEALSRLSAKPANSRITNPKKKPVVKIKPDTVTRQHLIIRRKSVKYNFEESDTAKLKEFIGPLLPSEFINIKNMTDSVKHAVDSVEHAVDTVIQIIAIKRKKDSINHGN